MKSFWQDLRFGLRVFGRSPILTLAAVLSVGLGIGANTAVFTVIKAVFLDPLPVREPSRLVSVFRSVDSTVAGASASAGLVGTSFLNYEDLSERSTSLASLAASTFGQFNIAGGDRPERCSAATSPRISSTRSASSLRSEGFSPPTKTARPWSS